MQFNKKAFKILMLGFVFLGQAATANEQAMAMMSLTQGHKVVGTVVAQDSKYGLLLTPQLTGLLPGVHGFHIHQQGSCDQQGMAAKGHLDPAKSAKHLGPYSNGHLGDLPVLIVNPKGVASLPLLAPRLSVKQVLGHSLMIHAGGDNYSDTPQKLGGGGARLACGVFKPVIKKA